MCAELDTDLASIREQLKEHQDSYEIWYESPVSYLNWLYDLSEYRRFCRNLKSLRGKETAVKMVAIILCLTGAVVADYIATGSYLVVIITTIVVVIILLWIDKFCKSGPYYVAWEYELLHGNVKSTKVVKGPRAATIKKQFRELLPTGNRYNVSHSYVYSGALSASLFKSIVEAVIVDDNRRKYSKVFQGWCMSIQLPGTLPELGKSVIKITADSNWLSQLAEDTTRAMLNDKREFVFNSEKLNKELDCRVIHGDSDNATFAAERIITPWLEDIMEFIVERWHGFSLFIYQDHLLFTVDLRSASSIVKKAMNHDFGTYRTAAAKAAVTTSRDGMQYYSVLPVLEDHFLPIILSYSIMAASDAQNYNEDSNAELTGYMSEMEDTIKTKYSEFKSDILAVYNIKEE